MQDTVSFKMLLERCGDTLACRLAVAAVCLRPDEFAGIVLGYVGEGTTRMEPFHAQFKGESATTLVIGDYDALGKTFKHIDTRRKELKEALGRSGERILYYCNDTTEGFWEARRMKEISLQWLQHDADCALAHSGELDERVWAHISAHLGVPAGLEQ